MPRRLCCCQQLGGCDLQPCSLSGRCWRPSFGDWDVETLCKLDVSWLLSSLQGQYGLFMRSLIGFHAAYKPA